MRINEIVEMNLVYISIKIDLQTNHISSAQSHAALGLNI